MQKIIIILLIPLFLSCGNSKNKALKLCHTQARYMKNMHAPNGIKVYFDYEWAIECAKKKNKPLFIYFTGHASFGDRSVELNFRNNRVKKLLSEEYIPVFLYVDDKTKLPVEDYIITATNDTLKTVGRKNTYWQITKFGVNAQPYFALIDYNGNLLNTPVGYTNNNVEEFIQFLKEGLNSIAP